MADTGYRAEPPPDPGAELRVMRALIAKYPAEARQALAELDGAAE